MADTLVSDAVAFPQDEGLDGISNDQERWSSAGYLAALAQFIGSGGYVHSGLTFSGHDAAKDQVDLDAGRCFVVAATGTMGVDVQSTLGGLSSPAYDTTLQAAIPLLIELPTTVTNLAVQDSTTSAVWVAYDNDGTGPGSAGTVYVRTDDTGSVTAPSHPSVKIGEANPDDSTADTRANDNPTETFQKVTTESLAFAEGYQLEEDDNSPLEADSAQAHTYTMADSAEHVIVLVDEIINRHSSAQDFALRVNGDSAANYVNVTSAGTRSAGNSDWRIRETTLGTNDGMGGRIYLRKMPNVGIGVINHVRLDQSDDLSHGNNGNVSSPITQFTLRGVSGNIEVKARVLRSVV